MTGMVRAVLATRQVWFYLAEIAREVRLFVRGREFCDGCRRPK